MSLFSPVFFGFFLILLTFYYTVNYKYQKWLLFISSSLFVLSFSFYYLVYVYLFILTIYCLGLLVDRSEKKSFKRKLFSSIGIFLCIFSLIFFKYLNFIISNINSLFKLADVNFESPYFSIIVPLGISYFTFQGISYLFQVNKQTEKAEENIIIFANYIFFFPKFLIGPIELSKNLIPQLNKSILFDNNNIKQGLKLMLWGAFKKIVVADRLSVLINTVYGDIHSYHGSTLLITFLLQPMHLYFDFSGYTDVAIGIAKTFGISLTNNFQRPFFSPNVSTFWRRWHISLTSWCNTYIFNRIILKRLKWGTWASVYAVFVAFLIIGIWHGPRWTFIIIGLLQGIAINYEFFTKRKRLQYASRLPKKVVFYLSCLFTYLFICFTLIFFNAFSLNDAFIFINNMFRHIDLTGSGFLFITKVNKLIILIGLFIVMFIEFRQENGKDIFTEIEYWSRWKRYLIYYGMIILIVYFSEANKGLVYVQF